MSIPKIDKTSTSDPAGQDGAIVTENGEVDESGIWGSGVHGQNPAMQKIDSGEEEKDAELDKEEEGDVIPAPSPPTSAPAAGTKTIFGIKKTNPTVIQGNDTYDYEQKYPEDAPYEEAAPAARVWKTYEDETRKRDVNMVEESRDSVDVLLVFAGLFSAVVTTFVAQTSQSLQPDYAAMSASLLYESVLVQRAIANGSSVNTVAPSPLNPTIAFVPATTDVWVNGLWFMSLFLSLTTALVAVLVKQWLHHYIALPSGTPRDRSFTRHFRYAGFEKWHVPVIIGLLPVLMHLALAIFLSGLVIYIQPLRVALSWIICAGAVLVYIAYVVTTILPIIFPECPYRTPLCNLLYISLRCVIPRDVTWNGWQRRVFFSALRDRDLGTMFRYLPCVQARTWQSLTTIESNSVRQMSTNLAAEALHWLFSVSSNPIVQSIVIQSIGGLPMASEEILLTLMGDDDTMHDLQGTLLARLQGKDSPHKLVPETALELGRLLRVYPRYPWSFSFTATPEFDSFEVTVAILSNGHYLSNGETGFAGPGAFFLDIIRSSSELPPRCWYHLMSQSSDVLSPLDPDNDDHTNHFPLQLCSAILEFNISGKGLTHDFHSPLVVDFWGAFPYIADKVYDLVLPMFSEFASDISLGKPLLLRVAAIRFLLHRLSLPDFDMSHTIIRQSLLNAVLWIGSQTFSLPEATAVMTVLDDFLSVVPPFGFTSNWVLLWNDVILTYPSLTTIAPSACSLSCLRSMVDFMTSQWDWLDSESTVYMSDPACRVLTDLLTKRIPVAYTAFLENECLQFLGNHTFHGASVPMVSAYVAGISSIQHELDGAVDEAMHIDHLHNPQILFTVCSILATYGVGNVDRTAIRRDITRLAQLRPRDTAWDECRRRLRDLAQGDGGDFFTEQRVESSGSDRQFFPLRADEIEVEKDNIRYAIHVLDNFFDGRERTVLGHLDRLLGRCLGRKTENKRDEEPQV